jgi:hypothetical protein
MNAPCVKVKPLPAAAFNMSGFTGFGLTFANALRFVLSELQRFRQAPVNWDVKHDGVWRASPPVALFAERVLMQRGYSLPITVLVLLLLSFSPVCVRAAAPDNEQARQTAKSFAPWLRALAHGRMTTADNLFHMSSRARDDMTSPEASQILSRLANAGDFDISVVGVRSLGPQVGIVLFTLTTADGPVAFKIYYYGFGGQMYIDKLEIADHWSAIESMAMTFDPTVTLTSATSGDQTNGN